MDKADHLALKQEVFTAGEFDVFCFVFTVLVILMLFKHLTFVLGLLVFLNQPFVS